MIRNSEASTATTSTVQGHFARAIRPAATVCDCGLGSCSSASGCGLQRNAQYGSREVQQAITIFKAEHPSTTDINAAFIEAIQQRSLSQAVENHMATAYRHYAGASPSLETSILCDPAKCEGSCTHASHGDPVPIQSHEVMVELFSEYYPERTWQLLFQPPTTTYDQTIAIIGAGPAGLQAAYEMRKRGYNVTVYEKDDGPGGLMRYGIPAEKDVVKYAERFATRLAKMGVIFQYNITATKTMLEAANYNLVMLATGVVQDPRWLPLNVTLTAEAHPAPFQEATERGLVPDGTSSITLSLEEAVTHGLVSGITQAMDLLTCLNEEALQAVGKRTTIDHATPDFGDDPIVVVGSGDTGTDILSSIIKMRPNKSTGPVTVLKRDIALDPDEATAGTQYHSSRGERDDATRRTKINTLGAQEATLCHIAELRFDENGALTGAMVQHSTLQNPETADCTRSHRKTEPLGEPVFMEVKQLLLALGYRGPRCSLLNEYGLINGDNNLTHVTNHCTIKEGVVVIGDADPTPIKHSNGHDWTVVDAKASANQAAQKAEAYLASQRESGTAVKSWRAFATGTAVRAGAAQQDFV